MKRIALGLTTLFFLGNCTLLTRGRCGDGIIDQSPGEICDDKNETSGDGCDATCRRVEPGFLCELPGEPCRADAECGDGEVEGGEECDDGNANNTDDCLDTCLNASCGDGFVESGVEACDPPNINGCDANCQLPCTSPADCVETPDNPCTENEDCDLVTSTCVSTLVSIEDDDDCTADACDPALGVTHDPEDDGTLCDADNNANTRDICIADSCEPSLCGDGFQDTAEGCDDGNNNNNDTCPDGPNGTCEDAVCGDGFVLAGTEQCDDGNNTAGDGCDATCQPEANIINVTCIANEDQLNTAIGSAPTESIILVDGPCGDITITNKSLTIRGTDPNTDTITAVIVNAGAANKVIFENVKISSSDNNSGIIAVNTGNAAFINTILTNTDSNNGSRVIDCAGVESKILLDRTQLTGNGGDKSIDSSCPIIISNSLIVENNNDNKGPLKSNNGNINILFSTFANNNNGIDGVLECAGNSTCILKSVVAENVQDPVIEKGGGTIFSMEDCFIPNPSDIAFLNVGNDKDTPPNLNAAFHLTNNEVKDQGTDNLNATGLAFDPQDIFLINIFNHDFNGNPRPQNNPDPGAFEEP